MAAAYEVKVTVTSAKDLKNVNWRYGPIRPYAVLWVDPQQKISTRVDEEGDTFPYWAETVAVPVPTGMPVEDAVLHIDVVHAGSEDIKPLIGSARLDLAGVLQDGGLGVPVSRVLKLKRPSGRHQGKLDVEVCVNETRDAYYAPAPPYGVPQANPEYYSGPPPPPYGVPQAEPEYYSGGPVPPAYGVRQAEPEYSGPRPAYGYQYGQQPSYGSDGAPASYGQPAAEYADTKRSKFGGMGTGVAVGAVAGVLGGLALDEGFDAVENDIAGDAAEKVEDEDNLGYDNDGGYDDDGF